MNKPKCAGSAPIEVQLEEGKKYAWCSCGLSENQPFCDGQHNQDGCEFRPIVFTAEKSGTAWFCTCKQTGDSPRCDGTHNSLAGEGGTGPAAVD